MACDRIPKADNNPFYPQKKLKQWISVEALIWQWKWCISRPKSLCRTLSASEAQVKFTLSRGQLFWKTHSLLILKKKCLLCLLYEVIHSFSADSMTSLLIKPLILSLMLDLQFIVIVLTLSIVEFDFLWLKVSENPRVSMDNLLCNVLLSTLSVLLEFFKCQT